MNATPCILAIDQGTTSSRAILFDINGRVCARAQQPFQQVFPADGWVEHDPEEIWQTTLAVCRQSLSESGRIPAAIGITNQRETVLLWDRVTGRPLHNAIVWQDRRTADTCERLREAGHEVEVNARTGLLWSWWWCLLPEKLCIIKRYQVFELVLCDSFCWRLKS